MLCLAELGLQRQGWHKHPTHPPMYYLPTTPHLLPAQYGALIIIDPEEEYYQEEISKLEFDIKHLGLGERA